MKATGTTATTVIVLPTGPVMRAPVAAASAIALQCLGWTCQLLAVYATMRAFTSAVRTHIDSVSLDVEVLDAAAAADLDREHDLVTA